MRTYEFALVLTEGTGKDEAEVKKFTALIVSKIKGKISKTSCWGLKQLSYPVKKTLKGWVLFMEIEAEEAEIKSLTKNLMIQEQVLRYLIIKKE